MPWIPVGRPKRKSSRIIVQSGPNPRCRGNRTTQPPLQSFQSAKRPTIPKASDMPMAAPFVPSAGMGPSPRIRITLSAMLSTVVEMPSTIGVRASPADRSALPSMKNVIIPMLVRNMMRRNGSASRWTAGAAFTRSSSHGERK